MSRKHAPPPDTDALAVAKAIARSLDAARERGETPVAIVMGPDIAPIFREAGIGGWSYGITPAKRTGRSSMAMSLGGDNTTLIATSASSPQPDHTPVNGQSRA